MKQFEWNNLRPQNRQWLQIGFLSFKRHHDLISHVEIYVFGVCFITMKNLFCSISKSDELARIIILFFLSQM